MFGTKKQQNNNEMQTVAIRPGDCVAGRVVECIVDCVPVMYTGHRHCFIRVPPIKLFSVRPSLGLNFRENLLSAFVVRVHF